MVVGSGTPLSILFQILGIDKAKSDLASISPEMSKIQQAAKGATTDANAMGSSLGKVGSSSSGISQASSNVQKLDTAEKSASTTANTLATNHSKLDTSVKSTGTSAGTTSTTIDKMDKSQTTASTSANTLSTNHGKLATSGTGVATASNTVTTSMDKQTSSMDKGAASTGKVESSHSTLRSSFVATAGSTTALVSSTVSLWESYDSLGDAQLRVDKASNTLQTTRIKEQSLQNQLNKLIADGKTGTDQYALVQDKLSLAHEKVTAAEGTLQNAQEDLNIIQIDFYKEIVPKVIEVLGSSAAVIGNMSPLINKFKGGLSELSLETIKTSNAFKLISLSNPLFIALTAGGAIITLFVTNMFGMRDAINSVGTAIGNALPPLKPFLTIIGSLGQGLVDLFGQGGKGAQAFGEEVKTGFETGAGGAKTGTDSMKTSLSGIQGPVKTVDQIIAGFANDSAHNWSTAGEATKAFPEGLQGSLTDAQKSLLNLVADAQLTVDSMQQIFTKTIKVGGLDVTGFNASIQGANITVRTFTDAIAGISPSLKEGITSLDGYSQAAANLAKVHTITNASTGKMVVNLDELNAALKASGLSLSQQSGIVEYLASVMKVQFVSAVDNDVSGMQSLSKESGNVYNSLAAQLAQQNKNITTSNQHAATNKNLAGTTKGVNDAFGQEANAFDDTNQAGQETATTFKDLIKQEDDLKKKSEESRASLNTLEGGWHLLQAAMYEAASKILETQTSMIKGAVAAQSMRDYLKTLEGQAYSTGQGVVTMQEELNKTTASIYENQGSLALLNAEMATGKPEQDAYNAGLEAERLALTKVELEIDNTFGKAQALNEAYNSGKLVIDSYSKGIADQSVKMFEDYQAAVTLTATVDKMHQQYQTGIPTLTAWTNGAVQQRKELEDMKISTDTLTASNAVYAASLADNSRQSEEYRKGLEEQKKVLFDLISSNAEAVAKNKEYADQINNTTILTAKFNEGQVSAEKSMLDMAASSSKTAGEISQLVANLKTGEEQATQYGAGLTDAVKKEIEMISETANLKGQITSLTEAVKGANAGIIEYNKGVEEGKVAALEHAKAVDEERGTMIGTRSVLEDLAKGYGVAAVAAHSSNDALQQFNDVMRESPSAIQKTIDALSKFADSAAGKIADAMGKGKGAVKDAIKSIQEELGRALTKPEIRTLEIEAKTQKAVTRIQDDLSLAFAGVGQGATASIQKSIGDAIAVAQQAVTSSGGNIKTAWQTILTSLGQIQADPLNSKTFIDSAAKITLALSTLGVKGQSAIDFLTKIGVSSDQATKLVSQFGQGAQTAGQGAQEANPALQEFSRTVAGFGGLESVAQQVFGTGIPGAIKAAAPNITSAFTTYMNGGLNTFTQALLLLGPATTQAVGQVNTAFGGLNPLQQTYISGMQTITTSLTLLAPAVSQAITAANTSFGIFNPLQQSFITGVTTIETSLNLLITESQQTVTVINTAFNTLNPLSATFTTGLTTIETGLNLLATETGQAVGTANLAFTALQPLNTTFITGMQTIETALNLLSTETGTAVGIANTAFATLNPISETFTAGLTTIEQALNLLGTETATAVGLANTAFTALQPVNANFITGMQTIEQALNLLGTETTQAVGAANTAFTQLGVDLPTTLDKMQTDFANAMNALVNIAKTTIPQISPIFTEMQNSVSTIYATMVNQATAGFSRIVVSANSAITQIPPIFTTMVNSVASAVGTLPAKTKPSFDQITTQSNTTATNVKTQLPAAFQTVISAASSMGQKVASSFQSIASSAQTATNAVRTLQANIDKLQNKTVTITVVTRYVTQGSPSGYASGFGPSIVDHPTNMLVGESGPEYVSVIPLKTGGDKFLSPVERLEKHADFGNVGSNSIRAANGFYDQDLFNTLIRFKSAPPTKGDPTHTTFSEDYRTAFPKTPRFISDAYNPATGGYSQFAQPTPGQGGGTINIGDKIFGTLNNAVNGVSKFLASASGALITFTAKTNAPGITSPGGGTTYADYGTTSGFQAGHGSGFVKLSDTSNLSSKNNIFGSNRQNVSDIGDMIGRIALRVLDSAASKMSFSINNQNIIDGKKIYESQQRHFGLKNGTLLK